MARPQQPELARSGKGASDPASAKARAEVEHAPPGSGAPGPVPDANAPGHHPDHDQDRPVERFAAKAAKLAARSRRPRPGVDAVQTEVGTAKTSPPKAGRATPRPTAPAGVMAFVPAAAFVDALRLNDTVWSEIGERKVSWLGRIAFLPIVGSSLYAARIRPRLTAAANASAQRGG